MDHTGVVPAILDPLSTLQWTITQRRLTWGDSCQHPVEVDIVHVGSSRVMHYCLPCGGSGRQEEQPHLPPAKLSICNLNATTASMHVLFC